MAWIACWLALTLVAPTQQRAAAQAPAAGKKNSELTPEQAAKLKQRDALSVRAQRLRGEGKLPEAIEVANQIMAIERDLFGAEHAEIAGTHGWIAEIHETAEEFAAAEKSRQAALDLLTKLHGVRDWRVTDARLALQHTRLLAGFDNTERKKLGRAAALDQRVSILRSAGKSQEALTLAQEALEIRKKVLGEEHPHYASSLNSLAGIYMAMGDYTRSEPLYRQALEIMKKVLGEEHPGSANSANNLAEIYVSMGDYARAKPLHRQALEIKKRVLGEEHPDYAGSLSNLAALHELMGEYANAEPLYRQALAIRKKVLGEEHPDFAGSLNNLAGLYLSMADYTRAEPLLRQALEILKKAFGKEHPDYSVTLNNLAYLHRAMGNYARAEPLLLQTLEIRRNALGEGHPDYAQSLNNLAALYESMADYARAEALYRQAMEIWKKVLGEAHPDYATCVNNLAALYDSMGDYARAEPLYVQALEVRKKMLGEEHPNYASSLNNLAELYRSMKEYTRAKPLYHKALAIRKKVLGEKHPDYATSLNNLALLNNSMGDFAAAEPLYRQALGIRKNVLGEVHPRYAGSLKNLGVLYSSTGDHMNSLARLRNGAAAYEAARLRIAPQSLDRAAFGVDQSPYRMLAAVEAGHGDPIDAWRALEADMARCVLDETASRAGQKLTANEEQQREELIATLEKLHPRILRLVTQTDPNNDAQAELAELLKQRSAVESQLAQLAATLSKRQVADLKELQASLPAKAAFVTWVDDWTIEGSVQEHWGCVVRADRPPAWVRLPGTGTNKTWTDSDRVVAERFREALAQAAAMEKIEELSRQLAAQRIEPLLPHLDGVNRLFVAGVNVMAGVPVEALTDRFAISYTPSGTQLARLSARPRPSGQATLLALGDPVFNRPGDGIEKPISSRLPTSGLSNNQVVAEGNAAIAPRRENDLLLARVMRGKIWKELPGTRFELAGLAKVFAKDKVKLLADSNASEQQLAAMRDSGELASFHYLHFATHGQVNQASAFESALILAQDHLSTADDVAAGVAFYDGRLTANEILQHWKLNAELVTLSSCESGLGRDGGGEGFLGFAQALLLAGSRSVCLSLWEVDDTATALLMDRFYQNLLGKRAGLQSPLPKAESLAEAKRWLRTLTVAEATELAANLSHGVARGAGHKTTVVNLSAPIAADSNARPYAHPYYWAAFVLIGDAE
jgi:CHAT domain-containing protein/Tfp pilus assembly protein PilF